MPKSRITSETVIAYSQCPQKAFLLLCTDEQGTPHEYMRILEQQKELTRINYIRVLKQPSPEEPSHIENDHAHDGQLVIKVILRFQDLQPYCTVLTRRHCS